MERSSSGGGDHSRQTEPTAAVPPEDPNGAESENLALKLHHDPETSAVDRNQSVASDSEEMLGEEEEEEEEEEELFVLDPEHPLVRKQQAALKNQLQKQLQRIQLQLKNKLVEEKHDASLREQTGVEMFRIQEQLGRLHSRLEEHLQTKSQAEAKHRQAQDQLETLKSKHSGATDQHRNANASVSQLQAETDQLMLQLVYAQGVSDDLRSNVKATRNIRSKAAAERSQAEEQKLKQDLYVDRLTKDQERLTQQIRFYEAQTRVQLEETRAAQEAHTEAEMETASLLMVRKQLLQQWKSSLLDVSRRNEAVNAMQEVLRTTEHQVTLLDREIEGYKKSIAEEQEQNETLTLQLNWSQMDGVSSKKQLSQKQAQQEALQAQYSTCVRILRETERTLAQLTKDTSSHQAEVSVQRRQLEKESAVRLEFEERILKHLQQQLTHSKAAQYSQQLSSKSRAQKKQKTSQLWQLENELLVVELDVSEVGEHLDGLALAQEALDEETTTSNQLLTSNQAKSSSFVKVIEQRQSSITNLNRKIGQIAASTGQEDLSPLHIKVEALVSQSEELEAFIQQDQQQWMKQQGVLVGLTQEVQANGKNLVKLQTEFTALQQKRLRLEKQTECEQQEVTELQKNMKLLRADLLKLNSLLSKNGRLSHDLQQETELMETELLQTLKEGERESIQMQMKVEKTEEEKERLLNSLVEAERQVMLWEKKIQLVKETRAAVDSDVGQGEIHSMKAEIHRMEVRLNQLKKQQEQLVRESEATVSRRETLVLRREVLIHSSHRPTSKGDLSRLVQGLQRKIRDTHKHVAECEQGIKEVQEKQAVLGEKLTQQKQQLTELCSSSLALDHDFTSLQDSKDKSISRLVALQSRVKRLQGVREGTYRALSTSETVDAALRSQVERVHATGTVLHRLCGEFPQHQGALRRVSLALAAQTQALEQEAMA